MKTLYLDTFSGISGDMMLGLLVDLGVDPEAMRAQLARLPVTGYRLEVRPEQRHGIGGTRVEVVCDAAQPSRNWAAIDAMLGESPLTDDTRALARRIFGRLGDAEAAVHQVDRAAVHFHEVGAVDAIVDIVGAAIGLQLLGIDAVVCAPLPLSRGMIRGSHGPMPLPAPATLKLLEGAPVCDAACDRELVTPTGAAIAMEIAQFGALPEMTLDATGYGVGGWQLDDRPNLLRGVLGRREESPGATRDRVTVIESHIDDSPAEWLGALLDRLMAAGALDAAVAPLTMKKNRPGARLTVVARPAEADALARIILRESSAIGVRMHDCRRLKLIREAAEVATDLGTAAVKLIYEGDRLLRIAPEHDSCVQLAARSGRPLPEVYRRVAAAAQQRFGLED